MAGIAGALSGLKTSRQFQQQDIQESVESEDYELELENDRQQLQGSSPGTNQFGQNDKPNDDNTKTTVTQVPSCSIVINESKQKHLLSAPVVTGLDGEEDTSFQDDSNDPSCEGQSIGDGDSGSYVLRQGQRSSKANISDTFGDDPDPGPVKKRFIPFFRKYWPHLQKSKSPEGKPQEPVNFSPSMYGKPIEEVDPFVFDDTFCVISKKFNKNYIFRFSASKSLFLLGPLNPFRRLCLYAITHQIFDICIIIAILSNCVALAFDSNELRKNERGEYIAEEQSLPQGVEWAFLIVYTTEMILKVGAKGFVLNKYSYLRNGWNMLDFIVVVFGYVTEFITLVEGTQSDIDLDIFRTFRVLRAVKTISILPGLRMMINALMNSMVQLVEVMALTFFCLCIFALFALEVYMGKLHQVCVLDKGSDTAKMIYSQPGMEPISDTDVNRAYEYRVWVNDRRNWHQREFPKDEFLPCGNDTGSRRCPTDYTCLPNLNENPDDGWTSFDNFFKSMLSTFQLITLDYWERLYELVMSTTGPWCMPFFIMVVFLGSFYLLNLMLAVVTMSYEAEASSWDQKPLSKHQRLTLHRSNSTFSFDEPVRLHVTLLTHYARRTPAEREMLAKTLRNTGRRKPRRALRRKRLSKQNERNRRATATSGANELTVTPDLRSTSGSVCGSIYGSEILTPPQPTRPKNKILHSGVLGERSISQKPESKPEEPKINFPQRKMGIYQVVQRVSSTESHKMIMKPVPKSPSTGSINSSGGIRVNARVKVRKSSDSDRKPRFFLEAEDKPDTENSNVEVLNDSMLEVLDPKADPLQVQIAVNESLLRKRGNLRQRQEVSFHDERAEKLKEFHFRIDEGDIVDEEAKIRLVQDDVFEEQNNDDVIEFDREPENQNPSTALIIEDYPDRIALPTSYDDMKFDLNPNGPNHILSDHSEVKETAQVAEPSLDIIRLKLAAFVSHWGFEVFITFCIVLNTLLLAAEHHDQPKWLDRLISTGSHCFTAVFTFECIIKVIALRRDYFRQSWNLFDLFIVFSSFLDLILEQLGAANGIRVMRLLRIFKLAQSWVTMKILLNIIFSTFGALGNLTLVLAIVIYIFAVLGMQVVGKEYIPRHFGADSPYHEDFPRWTFRNFWYSFMMIFRVLCGEWIEPLWDCLLAHRSVGEQWKCFLIFLPVLIIGNFIVLNLFLALLLNSFSTEELKAQRDKEIETSGKTDNLKRIVGMLLNKKTKHKGEGEIPSVLNSTATPVGTESEFAVKVNEKGEPLSRVRFKKATQKIIMQNRKARAEIAISRMEKKYKKEPVKPEKEKESGDKDHKLSRSSTVNNHRKRHQTSLGLGYVMHETSSAVTTIEEEKFQEPDFEDERPKELPSCVPEICLPETFHCCDCWEKTRKFALSIVTAWFFEWSILGLILASSVTLCFEDIYLEQNPDLKFLLFILNNVFTLIFLIEMLLKWMALGLYQYFTTFWTLLDAFIVVVSLITLAVDIEQESWKPTFGESQRVQSLGALKALRTLRALRPLRAISRWQGMKVVVNALMYAIPSIFNVLLVCLLFWLIFAIMGVNLFKGRFYKCVYNEDGSMVSYDNVKTMDECCKYNDSSIYPNATSWINTIPNFDNVFWAYLSLFQVATFEGWIEIMRSASDVTSVNEQPLRDSSYPNYIFFVIFIIFGAFFTLNLFIGVIIDNFNMLKKKYEGNLLEVLLTPSQRRYYTAMKKLGRKKPRRVIRRPKNKFFALFYDISMSRRFEIAIFVMIFLNMVVMAFEQHNQRPLFAHILAGFNAYFSTIYALEAIVKIIGLRHYYFTIAWNVFDFCLVIFSLIDLFLADASVSFPFPPTLLRVVRVFRIGRVLRLIKAAKGIRKLLFALIVSLPALFNIGALLALITFIYSVLGMALFKDAVKSGPIDDLFSFETFVKSSLMLFRLLTAAGWNEVLDSLMDVPKSCGEYRKIECGQPGEPECVSQIQAVMYMVTYIIITYLIVINMYIAIILENFVEANRDEEVGIVEEDLESFYIRWSRYDPAASQFIGFEQLSEFLASLDPPLDIPKPNIVAIVAFNLPIARGNKIHCLDILHALVKHVLGQVEESDEFRKVQEQMERKFRKQFPTRKQIDVISSTRIWKLQQNSATIIQRAWRTYKLGENPPLDKAKSTQTLRPGFGQNMLSKMGNFFHGDDRKRRRSSIANPSAFLLGGYRKPSDRMREGSPNLSHPRSSYSSQSSSSASPLARLEESDTATPRGRRLSPSRMSGGSFEVAINFGNAGNNQLLPISSSCTNKSPSPVFNRSRTSSIVEFNETRPQSPSSLTFTNPSFNTPLTPLTSCPTSPSSSFDDSHSQSSVIVQVHPSN